MSFLNKPHKSNTLCKLKKTGVRENVTKCHRGVNKGDLKSALKVSRIIILITNLKTMFIIISLILTPNYFQFKREIDLSGLFLTRIFYNPVGYFNLFVMLLL